MRQLEFTKMSGCGNDFIAINNMDLHFPEEGRRELFADWCRRGLAVGADGVIILEPAQNRNAFKMRYYNADGGEAATCGNGSRCMAKFAYIEGVAPADMTFETVAGLYHAVVYPDGRVTVTLSDTKEVRPPVKIDAPEFCGTVYYANTGVPHAVVFVDDLEQLDVFHVGRFLRYHDIFAPAGANINFVQVIDEHSIAVRTYERGVENETLACGTGSVASVIIAQRLGYVKLPVSVKTHSCETLEINFTPVPDGAAAITLTGGARVVYHGKINY